jgi:hypothetical protein
MFKKTLAAAVALISFGFGEAVMAAPEITEQVEDEHVDLVALVNALGVEIKLGGPVCAKGWYGAYAIDGSELILCNKAGTTKAERLNTIRHEAAHVLQDIKDCKLKDKTPLMPIFTAGVVPKSYMSAAAKDYSQKHVSTEAEAFWAADTFEAEHINILIFTQAKSCGYQF